MVQGLTYRYQPGGPLVLKGIDFHVSRGEIVAVTGLSGCGKSTLCYCICGAFRHNRDRVMTGQVLLNGKNMGNGGLPAWLEVGMVFQDQFAACGGGRNRFVPENLCLPSPDPGEGGTGAGSWACALRKPIPTDFPAEKNTWWP